MASRAGVLIPAVAAGLLACISGADAATAARRWSVDLTAARIGAVLERQGSGEALVITVTPQPGVRIEPPVVRIDAPTLVSRRLKGRFPTTVRGEGKPGGAIRAALPLDAPGAVRVGETDSNDGALRVEYRACAAGPKSCTVERADIPLRVAP